MSTTIVLQHMDVVSDPVSRIDILMELLIGERKKVLFIGETNFSLSVAFAALRKYKFKRHSITEQLRQLQIERGSDHDWDGIISTRYEPEGAETKMESVGGERVKCKPPPLLSEIKLRCISESIKYALTHPPDLWVPAISPLVIQSIVNLQSVPGSYTWLYKIDACAIPPQLLTQDLVIWFQCPWKKQADEVKKFLRDVMLKNAREVKPDTYMCIGIIRKVPFVKNYMLEGLLGDHLKAQDGSNRILKYYKFLGADDVLINKVLSFGYYHDSSLEGKNIHDEIVNYHLTLVFQRKHD